MSAGWQISLIPLPLCLYMGCGDVSACGAGRH